MFEEDEAHHALDVQIVHNVFLALDKAVRARRLYQPNNPVYHSFLNTLREALTRVWTMTNALSVNVEEHGFVWEGNYFSIGEGRENLPFQFYKDGIRYLTFLPTFEDELERFLDVVYRARSLEQNSNDDMVTILWEREFSAFQYSFVDALAEGIDIPTTVPVRELERVDNRQVAADTRGEAETTEERPHAMLQGKPTVATSISRDEFEETLYFLEPSELEILREEVEKEWRRELKVDVLNALFDRLEDPLPARQAEIIRILRLLLPAFLARGDLRSASAVLVELSTFLEGEQLSPDQKAQTRELFAELNQPAVLSQLLRSLQEGAIDPTGAELGVFLRHLGAEALPALVRVTETTTVAALQERLRSATEQLGRAHPQKLIELVRSDDEATAIGAARLAGLVGLPTAASALAALLSKSSAAVRKAAVEALVQIKSGPALEALQNALDDDDRDVRVAAARGLAALRYQPARTRLEAALQGPRVRDADLTEKIAFFEAFGAVANADSVAMLDRLLNGKNLLRQRQSPEIRACAAMALGKVGSPASRAALEKAAGETNPMVRNAVAKALRRELNA
jgi:HEAT repeat protein